MDRIYAVDVSSIWSCSWWTVSCFIQSVFASKIYFSSSPALVNPLPLGFEPLELRHDNSVLTSIHQGNILTYPLTSHECWSWGFPFKTSGTLASTFHGFRGCLCSSESWWGTCEEATVRCTWKREDFGLQEPGTSMCSRWEGWGTSSCKGKWGKC